MIREHPTPAADDEALLRSFEPVLCFNLGEQFYPMDVDRYLARARLCAQRPGHEAETLVARGRNCSPARAKSSTARGSRTPTPSAPRWAAWA